MIRTFRVLAVVDGLLLAAALLYRPSGEDPAGAGMRLGIVLVYAVALAAVLLVFRFVANPWVWVPALVLLGLPPVSILYGLFLLVGA